MISLTSDLYSYDLAHKRIVLRADLNVPLNNTCIMNDYRLKSLIPTLRLIRERGGKIILATHMGRPTSFTADLSTSLLIPWFKEHGFSVSYEGNLEIAIEKSSTCSSNILLLENMRFFPGEKDGNPVFVQTLARMGDYYVNDAFGLLHRTDSSITRVPLLFDHQHRTIGLLVEKELSQLNTVVHNPKRPFVVILGGGKVSDKIPLLQNLGEKIDKLLLGPAIVNSFLKEQGYTVGKSLVDSSQTAWIKEYMSRYGHKIIFPVDYQIAHETFSGPLSFCDAANIPADAVTISIGPKTSILFAQEISRAGTVFYNGLMGDNSRLETLEGMKKLFAAMASSNAFTIVAGGDSVAAAQMTGYASQLSYCSTGGGATLAYLAGESLPGLQPFLNL